MLYNFVRPIAKASLKVFFKHIYTSGFDKIPVDGPVLIPANHPTAFIEPCLAACFQHRKLNFIVRGDVFKNPFYIKLLKSLQLIPIFRFRDGYTNLKNNQETFKYCNEVLRDQKAIFILVEGRTIQEKRLRSLQKGTARMAFGAYEEYGIDNTVIVPMGISYENANNWRYDVIMACTEPLYLKDYLDLYKENANQAIQQLTDDIALRLPEKMVIIPDKHDDDVSELLCLIWQNDISQSVWPIVIEQDTKLKKEQAICEALSNLEEEKKSNLKHIAGIYTKDLKKYRLSDRVISNKYNIGLPAFLLSIIGLIIVIPGFVINCLPVLISRNITKKKVYIKEFYAPVLFASCTFMLLVWNILLLIVGLICLGWISILLIFGALLTGYLSIVLMEIIHSYIQRMRYQLLSINKRNEIAALRTTLTEFIRQ